MSLGMRLLLLDRENLEGHVDLTPLEKIGELTVYERTTPLESFDRVGGCEVLLTVSVPVGRALLDWAPRLRHIVVLSPRPDLVDMQAAADLGVKVTVLGGAASLGEATSLGERAARAIIETSGGTT